MNQYINVRLKPHFSLFLFSLHEEMDEAECDRRRTECMENLVDLERQFTLLREQ